MSNQASHHEERIGRRANLVVPRRVFAYIFRQIINELGYGHLRFQVGARHALQDAAENLIISIFSGSFSVSDSIPSCLFLAHVL
ncbi:histone H3.3-like [Ophiocordyceps camponoti-floridani]|uniref:Histone H3.3-like n=1 Tax=Ophiocordyceps camponoti-floridani TaxID=2030778 RepID=A0A8H4Q1V8_9HYPO|nr:histone H3.3-like [Ophiocordyceps camponoti-floridani]